MEFTETVLNRHSTRDFKEQPVPEEDLKAIISTAKMTPSWANDQIWRVVIATGKTLDEIKRRHYHAVITGARAGSEFSPLHRGAMGEQGRKNVRTWSRDLGNFLGAASGEMAKDSANLFNAAAVAYLLIPTPSSLWSAYDLGAFGQTLMLAATDRGIDSIPAAEFVQYPQDLHEILGVGSNYQFGMGIGLGYKKEDALINDFRSRRMDTNDFLTIKD